VFACEQRFPGPTTLLKVSNAAHDQLSEPNSKLMKEAIRRLNEEYGFKLTDQEIDIVARQAEDAALLFRPLFEVDVTGIAPLTKIDKKIIKTAPPRKA
jgi:H2-forming N5,N10-methylenetetrahydromethanopterin dehydrogenase-like enzyme